MEITAKQVMDLRAATGLPMMKCKKALIAEDGDHEKAFERLRKEGLKAADAKAGRAAGEGLVRLAIGDDQQTGAIVAVACETEPVSNTPMFQEFADRLLAHVAEKRPADVDALLEQPWIDDADMKVDTVRRELVARLGENIQIQKVVTLAVDGQGAVGGYVHFNGKIGSAVVLGGESDADALSALAKDVAMHVTSARPIALTRDEIPSDVQAKEQEIIRSQMADDEGMAGKPEAVLDKIAQGKLDAWFKGQVLPEQPWFKDAGQTVAQILGEAGATLQAFVLVQIGA